METQKLLTLYFYWTYLETQKLLIWTVIFVWCLLRQRNWGLNSGLKSATIVTDAYCKRARTRVCILQQSANPLHCILANFWERAVHTFSGLSGRLGSSGLSAHASEFTTERPEVSNYLPIQRCLLRAIYSSLLWPQISIACTRAYVVDDVWDTAVVHIYNEIVFDCAIEKCKTEAFINISICNWRLPFLSLYSL